MKHAPKQKKGGAKWEEWSILKFRQTICFASLAVTKCRNHVQIDRKNRVQLAGDALIAL
jgi:hypothetical protein